jgi:hypothetical protein
MTTTKLEVWLGSERTSKVLSALLMATLLALLLLSVIASPAHAVSTFTVNRTDDLADMNLADNACDTLGLFGSQCSLRAAIQQANATANSGGPDLIKFSIPTNGPHTIQPNSQLPTITQPVTIDGYTEGDGTATTDDDAIENTATTGTNAVLKIVLNGANAPPTTDNQGVSGLLVNGGGTTIRGLVINGFRQASNGTEGEGIFLLNVAGNTNNVIAGNFIGTDVNGTAKVSNQGPGVLVFGPNSAANTIGGAALADRNLISGNLDDGIALLSNSSNVQNNLIGTDKNATNDLGNDDRGVSVFFPGNNNTIGSGATTSNTIAFNGQDGVLVGNGSGTGNRILRNSIFSNVGLGIDLEGGTENAAGATANDPQDSDTGANNLQNKPVLDSAITSGSSTSIAGRLNSTPQKTFSIRYFSNPSGTNEGKKFIGQKSVSTNANGNTGTFTFNPAQAVAVGDTVTATATQAGSTSEFAAPRTVASS